MPSVNKQKFVRIQASHDPWSVAVRLSFGTDFNNLTRDWRQNSNARSNTQTGITTYSNEYLVQFMNNLGVALKNRHQEVDANIVLKCLEVQHKAITDTLLAVRELVFEDVRRKEFTDLPSRHTCVFLSPNRPECVRHWWKEIATQGPDPDRQIFEVEATGNAFLAPDLATLQTMSVKEWEDLARRYWSPHETESDSDEVLFAGEIEVVAERQKVEFGIL